MRQKKRFSPRRDSRPRPKQGRGASAPRRPGDASEVFMEGRLQVKARFGFLISEDPDVPDVYIGPRTLSLALPGDRVLARVRGAKGGMARPEGDIVRVVSRARSTVAGLYERTAQGGVVVPEPGAPGVRVTEGGGKLKVGQAVVLRITKWPTEDRPAEGAVAEVLGAPDDPGVDMKIIIKKNELSEDFPPAASREAASFGTTVPPSAATGRETFFHLPVFTIDGADAKDFDDAVSLERRPGGGWRLGVHIADVAHYVREGTALDEEAFQRATSVYLPGCVVPMLPPRLSDDLCSLRPDRLRLTLTCLIDLAADGRVTGARVVESAIRSARRFTYEEVESILQGHGTAGAPAAVVASVKEMGGLARLVRARRFQRGALELDFPEAKLILDSRGRPLDVLRRERMESHRLIEDFMLLANEAVAELMKERPFLYRVHEKPDPEKLEKLSRTLKAYGLAVPPDLGAGDPRTMQKVLKSASDGTVGPMIRMMALRSFKQAVYSPVNAGHYGLASPCYTHFTSPIRRYPDLCIHRIIKENLRRALTPERLSHWRRALPEIGKRSSFRERLAQEMEREGMEVKRVRLMLDRVGETFTATVSGAAPFGFFVQLDDVFVEGLVRLESLKDDHYVYDEARGDLRGRRKGRFFRLGQKVRVRLVSANAAKRQLEFACATDAPLKGKDKKWTWRGFLGLREKPKKRR